MGDYTCVEQLQNFLHGWPYIYKLNFDNFFLNEGFSFGISWVNVLRCMSTMFGS